MGGSGLARRMGFEQNELRRGVDRARAWVTVGAVGLIVGGTPLVTPPVMDLVHDSAARNAQVQAQHRHQVTAVLPRGAEPAPTMTVMGNRPVYVTARWTRPDGLPRQGRIQMAERVEPGGTVPIWVNDRGRPVPAPLNASQVQAQTVVAGTGSVLGTFVLVGAAALLLRRWLDRRAYDQWEQEWAVLAPRWSGRH